MTPTQTRYVASAPQSVRRVLERAFDGESSPRQAIKAGCLACSCFQRDEITNCRVILCPLWAYRPFQPITAEA